MQARRQSLLRISHHCCTSNWRYWTTILKKGRKKIIIVFSGSVESSNRTLYPTWESQGSSVFLFPMFLLNIGEFREAAISSFTLFDNVTAATLLGCVIAIRNAPLLLLRRWSPCSNKYWGICVVLPEPVSPTKIIESCCFASCINFSLLISLHLFLYKLLNTKSRDQEQHLSCYHKWSAMGSNKEKLIMLRDILENKDEKRP